MGRRDVAECRWANVMWWRETRTSTTTTLFNFLALFWSLVHGMSHLQSHLCAVWSASNCQLGQSSASECVTRIDRWSARRCVVWIDGVRISVSVGSIKCECVCVCVNHCMHRCIGTNLSQKLLHFFVHYGEADFLSLDCRGLCFHYFLCFRRNL